MNQVFVWLPFNDDELVQFAWEMCDGVDSARFGSPRMIDGEPLGIKSARWPEIGSGDRLSILAHGMDSLMTKLNTETIGWRAPDGQYVTRRYDQLARAISSNLASYQRAAPVIYELLLCYGGNKFLGMKSFGAKLATALGSFGVKGVVWAYKGGLIMSGQLGGLVAQGKSRITSRVGNMNLDGLRNQITRKDDGSLDISHWNYFEASTQKQTWDIP
jgi:hypothetical protein